MEEIEVMKYPFRIYELYGVRNFIRKYFWDKNFTGYSQNIIDMNAK